MADLSKGRSPFYPGQPVPVELFTGRQAQIDRVLQCGIGQVAAEKPAAFFVQGEYGIGKSSIAALLQHVAARDFGLFPIYASLGGARDANDIAALILEATIKSESYEPQLSERVRNWLGTYLGKQTLFGVTLNLEKLR